VFKDFVGLLRADWTMEQIQVQAAVPVPSRAHGLLAEPGGGFLAVASRPGQWLLRCDEQGKVVQWHQMEREAEGRRLDGHVCASVDGQWLTPPRPIRCPPGWIVVRERRTWQSGRVAHPWHRATPGAAGCVGCPGY
jgi:hypothetical protein